MKRGLHWPIAIAVVLIMTVVAQVWFAVVASADPSFAVEGDYYNKAVHWDDELAQRQVNRMLSWRIDPTLMLRTGDGEGAVSIVLRDSTGVGIAGAAVDVLAMHNARAARQLFATLTELGGGEYRAELPAQRPGEWELRFTVRRGGQRFTARERVDARVH
ncbi:MAG: hypothetical protein MNPFHGCM_03004 [Gemmatimonadaceae bacterium]|nr:hypothetical protein [Gemmatimonadaceae bacterium]